MKTIYNVYVKMESQEQSDRMEQLCIDNGLPIWKSKCAFLFDSTNTNFRMLYKEFFVGNNVMNFTQVTEQEFIQLLKTKS